MTKPIDRLLYLEMARRFVPTVDRRETRIPYRGKVKFRVFGLTLSGEILDISANGVYVATDYEVEMETALELVFSMQEENSAVIQAKGRVAWVNCKNDKNKKSFPSGFGVELIAITEESNRALKNYVEKHRR